MIKQKNSKHNRASSSHVRQHLSKLKFTNCIGGASIVMLALLALTIISPSVADGASAESTISSATTVYAATVNPTLSIALDKEVNVEFTPTVDGDFKNTSASLSISTNNLDGYKILMSTAGDSSDLTNLESLTGAIPSISEAASTANFPANSWGYNLVKRGEENTVYNPIPHADTEVKNIPTGDVTMGLVDEYSLNFGTKVTNSLPAGIYKKEITISVVANPIELRTLSDLTVMQDMNSKICKNTPIPENLNVPITKQLTDIRDGKAYWVSKLADGNCWMVQNLAYDITQDRIDSNAINPTNTDVSEVWNASSAYPPTPTITSADFNVGTANTSTNSWDLGDYILTNPTNTTSCSNITNNEELQVCNRIKLFEDTDDAHRKIGNYYQWNAATAGTGGTIVSQGLTADLTPNNAPGSICPKNWQLPTADGNALETKDATRFTNVYWDRYGDKTFANLFNAYGYTFTNGNAFQLHGGTSQNGYNLIIEPFYLTYAGVIGVSTDSQLRSLGRDDSLWSATAGQASTPSNAYYAYLNAGAITPSNAEIRRSGYSVRCIAR